MAVKRKKSEPLQALPESLDKLLERGFTASVLEKKFKELGSTHRSEIKEYFENNDEGFEIEISKAVKTEYGSVTLKERKNWDYDTDGIIEAFNAGKVTIETLLSIAKFSAENLTKIGLGDCATPKDPTEFIELRANADFKAEIDGKFGSEEVEKPKAEPKKKVKAKPATSSLDRLKAAKKNVKAKGKSADADLDAILEG